MELIDTAQFSDFSSFSFLNNNVNAGQAYRLRQVALRFTRFKRHRRSYRISHIKSEREERTIQVAEFSALVSPWQSLIEAIEFHHGIIVSSCIQLHRWFFSVNALFFLPILFFVILPQAANPTNTVFLKSLAGNVTYFNLSANNFSCTSFRTCFTFSWFFLTPYQPIIYSYSGSQSHNYNMQLAYLLCLSAFFVVGLCVASGLIFGVQPVSSRVVSLPLFAWVLNAWNHEISNEKLASNNHSLVLYRLKEHLRFAVRQPKKSAEILGEEQSLAHLIWKFFTRKRIAVIIFEFVFALLFAIMLVAVYYFYEAAEYAGVDGVVVETIAPLLAVCLPTVFLSCADLIALGIISGRKEKRLSLYQPWHMFFRAVLFRFAAIIVIAYRWTFCFPVVKPNNGFSLSVVLQEQTVGRRQVKQVAPTTAPPTVEPLLYEFSTNSKDEPPPFCPTDDVGWEVLVARQVVLLSLYTASFFLFECLGIFLVAKYRSRFAKNGKYLSPTFPASRFCAYAVTLDLLSLVGAYFFPLSPGLTALILLATFYSVTVLINPRFCDAPVTFSWNNQRPGVRGSSHDEHVFRAIVAVRFLRLFPYIFTGLFYMYIFYSVPVSPNCGPLRPHVNATHASHAHAAIFTIRQALIMPLVRVPVIGWVVSLLDQPPFAYLIAAAVMVVATFAIARVVSTRRRLDFLSKQLLVQREDSAFLFEELQKAKRRTRFR